MNRYEALDAWRGLCALLVVLFHFCFIFASPLAGIRLVSNAYLFVDFFFVLSGFVVAHAYARRLETARDYKSFVVRRFGRLWPLHASILLLFIGFIGFVNVLPHPARFDLTVRPSEYSLVSIPLHLSLLNAVNLHGMSWNAPSWSIGAEFYTYLLFGAVCILAGRKRVVAALVLSAGGLAVLAAKSPTYMNSTADFGLFRCVAGFFLGVAAEAVHRRLPAGPLRAATLVEIATVTAVVTFVLNAGSGPDAVGPLSLAAPVIFAAAVLVFAREGGAVSRLLRRGPFPALGRWSYSIYMTHQLILMIALFGAWSLGAGIEQEVVVEGHKKVLYDLGVVGGWGMLMAVVAAVIAVSAMTYAAIEAPARAMFNGRAARLEKGGAVRRVYALALANRSVRR